MFSSRTSSHALIFVEKLWIFMKIMKLMKNTENIKFSSGMHYRALLFIEEITDFKQNP